MSRPRQGFTLLEVMVAIAILGLALAAVFSSEAGAIKMAHRSRKMGLASLLARCKMAELEEQVAEEGLPALYDADTDECCEGAEIEGFGCEWEINPIVLPDNMFIPEDGEATPLGQESEEGAEPSEDQPPDDPSSLGPEAMLSGGGGGIGQLAMQFAYPVLKPAFESQIRRATVTVQWKEGSVDHSLEVTQYMVSDDEIVLTPEQQEQLAAEQAGETEPAAPGASNSPTAPAAPATPGLPGLTQ